jgi:peptidoglycan/xylan/chitin deacetylase (PgdA/CDA1 family)
MARVWTRRRFLAAGGVSLLATGAGGLGVACVVGADGEPASGVVAIDEADPTATPQFFDATPTVSPTATATATATASPAPSPTPAHTPVPLAARPKWGADLLRQVARSGPAGRPLVALTIDDGWSARDSVLEVLQAKKVQPTFFLTGRALPGDYGFVARALNGGCEVANHTMDHYDLTSKTAAYIQKDIQDFEDLVKSVVTGATTQPFMRPSAGAFNQTVVDASAALGYRLIMWSVSCGDGSASTRPDQMASNALAGAKPGSIILMHFSERAVTALPPLIDGLRAKGLEPVSLSKLFETTSG